MVAAVDNRSCVKPTYQDCERKVVQLLAGNDAKIRRIGLRKFKVLLRKRPLECAKAMQAYWKGLHYCMWMCDKPMPQEDLADDMCSILHNIPTSAVDCQKAFISAFFDTQAREWVAIDQWRTDKYLMLVRRFFRNCLVWLSGRDWPIDDVNWLCFDVLQKFVFRSSHFCLGLQMFVVEIIFDELKSYFGDDNNDKLAAAVESFVRLVFSEAASTTDKRLLSHFSKEVFDQFTLGYVAAMEERESDESPDWSFPLSLTRIGEILFTEASAAGCPSANRRRLYTYVKKYAELASTPQSDLEKKFWDKIRQKPDAMTLRLEDWAAPRQRSRDLDSKNEDASPKKKKRANDDNNDFEEDGDDDSSNRTVERKKKQQKKEKKSRNVEKEKSSPSAEDSSASTGTPETDSPTKQTMDATKSESKKRSLANVVPLWSSSKTKDTLSAPRKTKALPAYLPLVQVEAEEEEEEEKEEEDESSFAVEEEKHSNLEKFVANPPAFFKGAVNKAARNNKGKGKATSKNLLAKG